MLGYRSDRTTVAHVEDVDVIVCDEDDYGARAGLVVGLVR